LSYILNVAYGVFQIEKRKTILQIVPSKMTIFT